jgi:hypothetical protein
VWAAFTRARRRRLGHRTRVAVGVVDRVVIDVIDVIDVIERW